MFKMSQKGKKMKKKPELELVVEEYYHKLREQIKDLPHNQKYEALRIFFDNYEVHKKKHGSYKHHRDAEYTKKMSERYQFMFEQAIQYVNNVRG